MKRTLLVVTTVCLLTTGIGSAASADTEKTWRDRLDISGWMFIDADRHGSFWDRGGDPVSTNIDIRGARLELNYDLPKGWEARLQLNGSWKDGKTDTSLGSAYLRYTNWKFADVVIGKAKEAVGLERNMGADNTLTTERAMATDALTPGKSWGVHLSNGNKRGFWAASLAREDDPNNNYMHSAPVGLSTRLVWYPINTDQQTVHLGISGSLRDFNGNAFRIAERAELDTGSRVVRSAAFAADSAVLVGLEGIWQRGPLLIQAEYLTAGVDETTGPTWRYNGYYITGSYFLTGENHRLRDGSLRRVKLAGHPAVELIARYSFLDARDNGVGAETAITTLGVNYYHSAHVRTMLALLHPQIAGNVVHADPSGNAIVVRLQLNY
jgi:phosphate-selective porin OprO and OprP